MPSSTPLAHEPFIGAFATDFPANSPTTPETELDALREAARLARERPGRSPALPEAKAALALGVAHAPEAARLASAWELPNAPRLAEVPDSWWGAYATWLLAAPPRSARETAAEMAAHFTRRYEEIADWMDRNLAAAPIREAADAALASQPPAVESLPIESRAALQRARARVLQRAMGRAATRLSPAASRAGRPLRVGVLIDRLDHRPRGFALLARCAQLDPARVELRVFVRETTVSPLEDAFRAVAKEIETLPDSLAARHSTLLAAKLDALLFAEDLSTHRFPDAHIAQLRVAPLQLTFGPATTALSQIDMILLGAADPEAAHARAFDERVALLPGTLESHDVSPDRGGTPSIWTRELLAPDAETRLLVCGMPDAGGHARAMELWRALLNACPAAHLLVVPQPEATPEALQEIRSEILSLGDPRLVLHEPAPIDHGELASIIALADLAVGLDPRSFALALEAGVVAVSLRDDRTSILQKLAGLEDCVRDNVDSLAAIAAELLRDETTRARLAARVAEAAAALPPFADGYAMAADFASVIEAAWDEMRKNGQGAFRRGRDPVVPPAPASSHPGDLHAEACALLAAGRPERAAPCLLAAIQRAPDDASLWYELARAYHAAGVPASAIEAIEASLRLDDANAAAWRLLCALAVDAGNIDLARETLALATERAPDHPDLVALRARVTV